MSRILQAGWGRGYYTTRAAAARWFLGMIGWCLNVVRVLHHRILTNSATGRIHRSPT
jgi:hypothetical protein